MYTVSSNSLRLNNQRFAPSGSKDKGIITFEFVAKTQFLCGILISITGDMEPKFCIGRMAGLGVFHQLHLKIKLTKQMPKNNFKHQKRL